MQLEIDFPDPPAFEPVNARWESPTRWYVLALDEGHGVAKKANAEAVRASEIVFLKQVLGTK